MLGYVKIDKGELKVREYEVYTGYYCGVCKSRGRRYGQLPRMVLSYDAAFLAILLASLSDESDTPVQEHCIAHPVIKKKTVIRNRAIDYAGDVMLILAWYKLADDAADEGKAYAKPVMLMMKRIFRRLNSLYPELCSSVKCHLSALSALEREKCASIDMAAEAFSKIMEDIFTEGLQAVYGSEPPQHEPPGDRGDPGISGMQDDRTYSRTSPGSSERSDDPDAPGISGMQDEPCGFASPGSDTRELLARAGYHLGKWVYMIDAVDDIEENIESGAYNPLLFRFKFDAANETADEFRARIEPDLRFNLYHYLAMLSRCTDSLDIRKNAGIIENVIYFGLNRKTEEIIMRTDKDKQI